jgi:hypothetical protein
MVGRINRVSIAFDFKAWWAQLTMPLLFGFLFFIP